MIEGRRAGLRRALAFGAAMAGVAALAAAVAYALAGKVDRPAAFLGIAIALATGMAALALKRWAVARSLRAALGATGAVFGARLLAVSLGIALVNSRHLRVVAFVAGFFVVYFALQWLEIGFVSVEMKHRGGRGVR